ncbi:arrestin domain-containing protein 4-like isoform X2 [Hermetia illucens]|nr:arrestin domain-containing protein 4-like isoform X2 [Hermetia illucens]
MRAFAGRSRRRRRFTGKEIYLSSSQYIYGSSHAPPAVIQPGSYTYNFSCQLPYEVPSSFESPYGHIRYSVKVVLDRPKRFDDSFTKNFTVLKALDLNYEPPAIRVVTEAHMSKAFWGGLSTNPLKLKASIPQAGFVPGQTIPIHADIDNTSNIPVSRVYFCINQIIHYSADLPYPSTKTHVSRVASAKVVEVIGPKDSAQFDQNLVVPPIAPTSPPYARVVKVSYEIKVEAVVAGLHRNPVVTIPIILGTVPLIGASPKDLEMMYAQNSVAEPTPSTSTAPPVVAETDMSGPNIPPPSYEEAMLMERSQVADEGQEPSIQTEFTPRYPVYSSIPLVVERTPPENDTTKEKIVPC